MQLGMIGLGRMGSNMVRRLQRAGHSCVVYDRDPTAAASVTDEGTVAATSINEFMDKLKKPRVIWIMVPAAVVDNVLSALRERLETGDTVVDGGNSYYVDDLRRADALAAKGVRYVDVGTSGGLSGLDAGYCLMVGGDADAVSPLFPVLRALAPGQGTAAPIADISGHRTAHEGFLHCGPSGAGHFVKMIHNGIEYGMMAAYAEGLNVLRHANAGKEKRPADADTAPLRMPQHYQYDFDLAQICELWRRGSVVSSWLLDIATGALSRAPTLPQFSGRVGDSGEGRWTLTAAIDEGVPAPVLSAALNQRLSTQGADVFAAKLLSAMRQGFGGHEEAPKRA